MDATILIGLLFKLVYWTVLISIVGIVINSIWLVKDHYNKMGAEVGTRLLPWLIKWRIIALIVLGISFYYLNNTESAYRPKNEVNATVKPSSRRDEVRPFVEVTNAPTWDQRMATNRAQNEAARQEFDRLPDK